ncbi:fatty acid desaturase [Paenibacillus sp. OV219]|uniref:fatty acid desaturase n=1 Tax=Paenibacillus sp. OV219 TaxID=1884377 RepID=UPI0008D0E173|nr:fatty acid desaturase [Paenibacillus sp. OV219]SEN97516.1 omega-6 fatty acid desaturase (delta-12 desaturase) [Paenibacillus sp. OV219]
MMDSEQDHWRKEIAAYEKPRLKNSIWQIVNTIGPVLLLWLAAYWSLSVSIWLTLALSVVTGGFLVRTFIIFHDCCHKSFFKNRRANDIVGTITGIMTYVPYLQWKHSHTVHHATCGNLERRGTGDIWTMTVDEYLNATPLRKLVYRLYRSPFIMFTIGPVYIFLIDYRFNRKRANTKERYNTYLTNAGIAAVAGLLCWAIGWQSFILIQGTVFFVSSVAGIWLFYVQHQFEDSYYEMNDKWDYVQAAMQGSSYYKLPRVLRWISGNIGFHHIHHLSPRIPNYNLGTVHHSNPRMRQVQEITLLSSLASLNFRLWDEASRKFIGFRALKRIQNAAN